MLKPQLSHETFDEFVERIGQHGTPLAVPYPSEESLEAEALGAKWINSEKTYVIPHDSEQHYSVFEHWEMTIHPENLKTEFVPDSCIKHSGARQLTEHLFGEGWNDFRKPFMKRKAYRCEICGGRGSAILPPIIGGTSGNNVEAHEIWDYCDATNERTLKGIECLCRDCHAVKHINVYFGKLEIFNALIEHFSTVTNKSISSCIAEVRLATAQAKERSLYEWTTIINNKEIVK